MLSQEFIDQAKRIVSDNPDSIQRNAKCKTDLFRRAVATIYLETAGEKVNA